MSTADASVASAADDLARAAARWPDRAAIIGRGRTWTWAELDTGATAVAARLRDEGIGPGDPVLLVMANDGASAAAFHGSLRIGATAVLVHASTGRAEYDDVVERVAPQVVVAPTSVTDRLAVGRHRWLDSTAAVTPFDTATAPEGDPTTDGDHDAARVLLFTSGTTARAKGVLHTVTTLDAAAGSFLEAASLGPDDRFFLISPLSSITGVLQALVMAPRSGASVVLEDHWDDIATTDLLLDTGATFYGGPDVILARLLAELDRRREPDLPLRAVAVGGTMLDPVLLRRVEDRGVTVLRAYGSSEVPFSTVTPRSAGRDERLGRDGRPVPGVEIRIGSERDEREIAIRGPHMLVGFLDEDDAREAIVDGWYLTGDLGSLDDGSLVVAGRIKEIAIRNGVKVSLLEVERAVATLSDVEAALAYRVDDPDTGERVGAAVRLRTGVPFIGADLVAELRAAGLATVKLPEELIDWTGPFPETASGKVIRDAVASTTDAPRWFNDRLHAAHAPAVPEEASAP